jgi:hypothetical protein
VPDKNFSVSFGQYVATLLSLYVSHLDGVVDSILAIRPKVHEIKSGRGNGVSRGIKICIMLSLEEK